MPELTQGGNGDNSKATPASTPKPETPTPAPLAASTALPSPITFSRNIQAPHSAPSKPQLTNHQADRDIDQKDEPLMAETGVSEQPTSSLERVEQGSAEEETKLESAEKDQEGNNFIKKLVEYLMKLIQSQQEEEEQRRKQQREGSSFGGISSLAASDPQQEQVQDRDDRSREKSNSPKPKPSGKSTEEELQELLEKLNGSTDKDSLSNKQHNLDIPDKQLKILKDFATAFSPNNNDDPKIAKQKNTSQDSLTKAIGKEPIDAINQEVEANPEFGKNLGQFAQKLGDFLDNPTLKNGMTLANSALKIANPLAKAMSGVGVGQTDDPSAEQKKDSDKATSEEPQGRNTKKHPGSVPHRAPKLRPKGTTTGGDA